jgi:hypothetical protein
MKSEIFFLFESLTAAVMFNLIGSILYWASLVTIMESPEDSVLFVSLTNAGADYPLLEVKLSMILYMSHPLL